MTLQQLTELARRIADDDTLPIEIRDTAHELETLALERAA